MLYTLKNELVTVKVNSHGAELSSAIRQGFEYIWQGDKTYWEGQAPMMFPICGRVYNGQYLHRGKTYEMGGHGFLQNSDTEVEQVSDTELRLTLRDNAETRAQYPFAFALTVIYRLEGDTLHTTFEIVNTGDELLPVTVGGHPGFNLPMGEVADFEDYYLTFDKECYPDEMILAGVYHSGKKRAVLLEDARILRLRRSIFDEEALFMQGTSGGVTLTSDSSPYFVTMRYADMTYLGMWQPAHTDAPFVCIEPWCGFPVHDGSIEEICERSDMFRLPVGGCKSVSYSLCFGVK